MKVLFVHNYYRASAPSGEDAVARNERKLLEDHGVEVVSYEKFNDDIDESTLFKKIKLGFNTIWSRCSHDELLELISRTKPDLVHIHSIYPQISPSVYAACRKAGLPVAHTLHNFRFVCPGALLQRNGKPCEDCLGRWPWKALLHRCHRGSLATTGVLVAMLCLMRLRGGPARGVNRFIATTDFAKSRLVAGSIPAELIEVKPNFLPQAPLCVNGDRENYAVFVGRLSAEKGVATLIHAWRELGNMPLKVIGSGALRGELESLAAESGVTVDFMGVQDREVVLSVLGKAQFLVVPSECYETFGMVVIEAYACGTPVLVARLGALEKIVVEGETGLYFEPGNSADLARKAKLLVSNPAMARSMGEKGRQLFLEKFTPEQNFRMLMDIYRRALQNFAPEKGEPETDKFRNAMETEGAAEIG